MFERLKKIRQVTTAAAIGAAFGAYSVGSMTKRLMEEDVDSLTEDLRFLARVHATLQMVDRLVIDMYEESINVGEIDLPSIRMTKRFRSRIRRLWADDGIADTVGQGILRNLDVEIH